MLLNHNYIVETVSRALKEDVGEGDVSASLIDSNIMAKAEIISREALFVCGQMWVNEVFYQIDPTIQITWLVKEGQWLPTPTTLCVLVGRSSTLLTAERTALNFLQTLSATATQTHRYLLQLKGLTPLLLDTRKTIPGLRLAQKYAVACAGGCNHRLGLYDAFLIKENHIKSCGSISKAVEKAKRMRPDLWIEVEVENLEELEEALQTKPDRILLDNFSLLMLQEAVKRTNKTCPLEASGNVNLSNIRTIAETGVDYISVGSLTKTLKAIDLSLLIKEIQ